MSNGHQTTSTLAKGQLEVCGDPDLLTGTATASLVEEGCAPGTIIRRDRPWRVDLCWTLKGSLKRMICGYWCTHVHLESIGEGPEFSLPTTGDEFEFKG